MVTPARNVTPVLDAVWRGGGRTGPPKDARRPSAVLSRGKGSSCACVYLNTCDRGQCRSVMCCNENILWVQVWHFLKSKFDTFTSSGVYGLLRYWCLWSFSVWPGALQVLQLPPIIKKLFAIRSLVGVQTWKSRCVYKMQRAVMLEVICPAWAAD